jgi:hypothetical protein
MTRDLSIYYVPLTGRKGKQGRREGRKKGRKKERKEGNEGRKEENEEKEGQRERGGGRGEGQREEEKRWPLFISTVGSWSATLIISSSQVLQNSPALAQ